MKGVAMYRTDLINAAMGAQRLTNPKLAKLAGVGVGTVSSIRNGKETVSLPSLKKVADALELNLEVRLSPKPQPTA
jgi:transcriptional regulator with XRE-family HTH domain